MSTPVPPMSRADYDKAVADEWGVYVAMFPISINGVPAFAAGSAVPTSHVTRNIVDASLVAKQGTAAAQVVAAAVAADNALPDEPPAELTVPAVPPADPTTV